MWLFGSLALLLLFGEGTRARGGGKRPGNDAVASARSRNGSGSVFEGMFTARSGSRCTWTANGEKMFALNVVCEPGRRPEARGAFACEYAGEPVACASYGADARRYWRQVARALAKQNRLCADERAVLRAGLCAGAPPNAHFRLARPSTGESATTAAATTTKTEPSEGARESECSEGADRRSLAQEKCGETWASVCTFIFTIVQSGRHC